MLGDRLLIEEDDINKKLHSWTLTNLVHLLTYKPLVFLLSPHNLLTFKDAFQFLPRSLFVAGHSYNFLAFPTKSSYRP